MLRNYLTMALRTLKRNRGFAAINIGGLALGLAGCLLILNYIRYERSYDGHSLRVARTRPVHAIRYE